MAIILSNDEYFYTYYGITRVVMNVFAGFYIAICVGHMGLCAYRKSWAHGCYSFAYLLNGTFYFLITSDNAIRFLGEISDLMLLGSLTWLIIQWTHVMRPIIRTSANIINALSHFIMIIIIIRTAMSLILSTRTTFKEFSPIELFLASYWIQFPYHAIMLLLSIWGFFACPKEAQYTGCDIKRWQIGMLAIMWSALLLQLTFGYFNETIYGYYIMLIIIGCIPFYPRHTLNGHSIPPGKENALSGSSVMMATVSSSMVYTTAPVYSPYAPVGLMAPQQQQQQYSIQYAPVSIYPAHGQPIVQTSPGAMAPISQAYPVHVQVAQQPQQYSYRS